MTRFDTRYRPSVHGFRFGNRFRHHVAGPITFWGSCNGIAQVSLDYFHAGRAAPGIQVVDYGTRPASGLGAASWAPDRVDIFVRRDGDRIAAKRVNGDTFTDWSDVTSSEVSASPAAASWGEERIDLVVRGNDGQLWHQWYDHGWNGAAGQCQPLPGFPEPLGGETDYSPATATPFTNRVEVYLRGRDGNLWFKYFDGRWHDWARLGCPDGIQLASEPAAAGQWGWMMALIRGSDGAIWEKEWSDNQWQPWRSIGGVATSAPALASPFPGRAEAYVRGTNGQLYVNIKEGGHWAGWASLGAPPPGLAEDRPAAVAHRGVLDVYMRATDNTVWRRSWWGGGWQPWRSTEMAIGTDAQRLTDGINARLMNHTINPLLAAIPFGPGGLVAAGSAGRFVQFLVYPNNTLFGWASNDEMLKLANFLQDGDPVSLGLLASDSVFGHEVVAFGGDLNAGAQSTVQVYDPNYPGCDEMTITLNPATASIASSSGERWRSLWVRDDVRREVPPL